MKISNKKMEEAQESLERKMHIFLRERGWDYTSNCPSSRWMWVKVFIGYGKMMMTAAEAVDIELMSGT